jgi:hypothetical protein
MAERCRGEKEAAGIAIADCNMPPSGTTSVNQGTSPKSQPTEIFNALAIAAAS